MKLTVLALAGLLATSCGTGEVDGAAGEQAAGHTLTIEQSYKPSGTTYVEGALAEVWVVDTEGNASTATGSPRERLSFSGLASGRYTVRPALRPCDGNCDFLSSRTDECEAELHLVMDATMRVTYTPTLACQVTKG